MSRPQPVATPQTEGEYTDALCELVLRRHRAAQQRNAHRTWKALVLATTPTMWEALLGGQHVPRHQLHPDRQRFGL